jgi:hypothetical protein
MLAEGDAGPLIPSMAIEAIIRKCLAGDVPAPGARSAHHALELGDYEEMFARRGISTGIREDTTGSLYCRALGGAYATLPARIRELHDFESTGRYQGRAEIKGPTNPFARFVAALFGFPPAGSDVPVTLRLSRTGGVETWDRSFAGRALSSTQELGRGRYDGLIVERFGPMRFGMAAVVEDNRLRLIIRRWDLLGLPLPRALLPRVDAGEHADDGRFHFLVDIAAPLLGRLVRYEGWLEPATG